MAARISIIGAYGRANFGDQLLFNVLYDWLKSCSEDVIIQVPWGDAEQVEWPAGTLVNGKWRALLKSDLIVFGGGGYLGEPAPPPSHVLDRLCAANAVDRCAARHRLPRILGSEFLGTNKYRRPATILFIKCFLIALVARVLRIPYAIIGTGAGPVSTSLGRRCVAAVIRGAEAVSLRDRESADCVRALCPNTKVEMAADMVCARAMDLNSMAPRERRLAVHLGPEIRHWLGMDALSKWIDSLTSAGIETDLIADCRPKDGSLDAWMADLSARCPRVHVHRYQGPSELWERLQVYRMVVTTKLHVGIAAYCVGIMPVSICTHIKTRRFYAQAEMPEVVFPLDEAALDTARQFILTHIDDVAYQVEAMSRARNRIIAAALKNRQALEAFLDQHR